MEEIVMSQRMKGLQDFGSPAVDGWQIRKHRPPRGILYCNRDFRVETLMKVITGNVI